LECFLQASNPADEELYLLRLITEHIHPVVARIVRYKLQFYIAQPGARPANPDTEDIYEEIQLAMLKRLRDLKTDTSTKPIDNLCAYVATVARNTCDEYLRRKYPLRRGLKDRVRYYLGNHSDFTLSEDPEAGWLSGLADWTPANNGRLRPASFDAENNELLARVKTALNNANLNELNLHALIKRVLQISGSPIELDSLTATIAALLKVQDRSPVPIDTQGETLTMPSAGELSATETVVHYRQILEQVWFEIRLLPQRQRVALLFNLREPGGANVITLFLVTRIATFEQIALALEMSPEKLEHFWAQLPMDDLGIAEHLGTTRQHVINMRKSARSRLLRRTRALEEGRDERKPLRKIRSMH
jgi:DNA-directed RNA polymerase specialized sigma24 family protein